MPNPTPPTYTSFPRYLAAKQPVDDRALHRPTWETLRAQLAALPGEEPLRILEIGAGVGTMIERAAAWQLTPPGRAAEYRAIDNVAENIASAGQRLANRDFPFSVRAECAEFYEFANRPGEAGRYDLIIAHAVLDLLDLRRALPVTASLLKPGGLGYFTINFDGATLLQPEIDRPFDDAIEAEYHRSMDERVTDGQPSGDARTGRHLFGTLAAAGWDTLAAGASDWVVFGRQGRYLVDEAYFLHFIVETMHGALRTSPRLPQPAFDRWIAQRHAQIERGELVYIAHQVDLLAQWGQATK